MAATAAAVFRCLVVQNVNSPILSQQKSKGTNEHAAHWLWKRSMDFKREVNKTHSLTLYELWSITYVYCDGYFKINCVFDFSTRNGIFCCMLPLIRFSGYQALKCFRRRTDMHMYKCISKSIVSFLVHSSLYFISMRYEMWSHSDVNSFIHRIHQFLSLSLSFSLCSLYCLPLNVCVFAISNVDSPFASKNAFECNVWTFQMWVANHHRIIRKKTANSIE